MSSIIVLGSINVLSLIVKAVKADKTVTIFKIGKEIIDTLLIRHRCLLCITCYK